MNELSLNILDIVQNSISAEAKNIDIFITEHDEDDIFDILIVDDGKGMSEEFLKNVCDPFTTTRTTRKIGLGIPLLKMAAEQTGGSFEIKSKLGVGTSLKASFKKNHIDRMPLGDISETIMLLVMQAPLVSFAYSHKVNNCEFVFKTEEIKREIGDIPLNNLEVLDFIKNYIKENEINICGGAVK